MAGFEQLIIVGNVGSDPEMRYTQSGVEVCSFSVAVNRTLGKDDNGEKREVTTWYKVTCWRKLAGIAVQYVQRGRQVQIIGTVSANPYVDKVGQPAASLEVTASALTLLGNRGEMPETDADTDDLPF